MSTLSSPASAEYTFSLNQKKHVCRLTKIDTAITRVECPAAWIDQEFENEDIPDLLLDIPSLILEHEQMQKQEKKSVLQIRFSSTEKATLKRAALKHGFKTVSSYVKSTVLQ